MKKGDIIGLPKAAEELGISYSTASKEYYSWEKLGVRIIERKPGSQKKFYLSDIVALRDGKLRGINKHGA